MPETVILSRAVDQFRIRPLLEAFHEATGIPLGLMGLDGDFLVSLGRSKACARFHLAPSAGAALCRETHLTMAIRGSAGTYVEYHCALGIVDVAFPVVVDGERIGTVVVGPFLRGPLNGRKVAEQAARYGYDADEYRAALAAVKIYADQEIPRVLAFLMRLAGLVTDLIADHTARVRAERELIEANEELERKVEQRTRDLNEALRTLAEEAAHDHLTGLVNRRYLAESLEREIARSRRSGAPLSLVLIDMDGLKELNDRFGHGTGDRAIVAVAAAMSERVRTGDILGRWGGDEFCAVLADTPLEGAMTVAERLRAGVAADLPGTVSVGAAEWHGESVEQLVHRADDALYRAKRDGRNRCRAHLPLSDPAAAVPAARRAAPAQDPLAPAEAGKSGA